MLIGGNCMPMLIKDRLAFLKQLEGKKSEPKINELNKEYIDRFVIRNYADIILDIRWMFGTIVNALDAFDRLNNIILNIYHDNSVEFRNQMECDIYILHVLRKKGLFK